MNDSDPRKPVPKGVKISLEDGVAGGRYTNLQIIAMSETEFILDFGFVQPQEPRGSIHSRVIMSPRRAKGLLRALQERIAAYEERFGEIPPPGSSGPLAGPGGAMVN